MTSRESLDNVRETTDKHKISIPRSMKRGINSINGRTTKEYLTMR